MGPIWDGGQASNAAQAESVAYPRSPEDKKGPSFAQRACIR